MTADGEPVTDADIEAMEVILGGISKLYPDELGYANGEFQFPLTQEERFAMAEDRYDLLIRPKFADGTVSGVLKAGEIEVVATDTRRVL